MKRLVMWYLQSLRSITLYKGRIPMAEGARVFSVEYLPGQFDQESRFCRTVCTVPEEDEQPIIRSATTYVIEGGGK